MYDFTFKAIDLGITEEDRIKILSELLTVSSSFWHYNQYRGCSMLPILSSNGDLSPVSKPGQHSNLKFTNAANSCFTLKKILEKKIFPFMNPIGKVTILRTNKKTALNLHIDSNKKEIGSRQHKFRFVISGKIDKLYFLDKNLNKIYVPNDYNTYVMDGSHVHALEESDDEKITLCIGAPWNGQPNSLYENILKDSLYSVTISRPDLDEKWLHPAYR